MKVLTLFLGLVWLLLSGICVGCASGLSERLDAAGEYGQRKPEETATWFQTHRMPMTFVACREVAHERTLKLTRAKLDAQLAQLQSNAAFTAFLPQVEATFSRSGTNKTLKTNLASMGITAQMQDRWVTDSSLTITQPIFAPNAWLLWVAARRGAELQALVTQRNEELLDVQLATLFYRAAVADRMVAAYEAQSTASRELKRHVNALAKEGMALQGDVARLDAIAQRDCYNEQIARDNAFAAKADLLDLMNFYPLSTEAPAPDGDSLLAVRDLPWARTGAQGERIVCTREEALKTDLGEWLWAALVNRKELWAGDVQITLHKVEAMAALAKFLPTFAVSGGGAYTSNSYLTPDKYLTGGIGGVMSIFDGLISLMDYQAAREKEEAAYALREDCASTLIVSVWQAWTNWRQARDRTAVAAATRTAAEMDYAECMARYEQGQETLSEVLNKYSAMEMARIDALSSDYAEALAEYVFRDTIGLGWGDENKTTQDLNDGEE